MFHDRLKPPYGVLIGAALAALLANLFVVMLKHSGCTGRIPIRMEARVRSDITSLSNAHAAFRTKFFDGGHIPSRFLLLPDYAAPAAPFDTPDYAMLVAQSRGYLKQMFPGADLSKTGLPAQELNGNQCLLFFLAGYSDGRIGNGFSTSQRHPFGPLLDSVHRIGPFMEAPPEYRLTPVTGGQVPMYLDYNGVPFAYMSSRSGNDYDGYGPCDLGPFGVVEPYKQPGGKYLNPNHFQIVSAGPGKKFGPGGEWTPGKGAWAEGQPGADDLANFSEGLLGLAP